jgi:hypothetical protein
MYAIEAYKERYGKPPTKRLYKNTQATAFPVEAVEILDEAIAKVMEKSS